MIKKLIAECLGTFVLVFFACGVAALTGGNEVATSLAFGLVIVAMAYSIGRISGCHINPAVSLALAIDKRITWKEFAFYSIAQILGGFIGAILFFGIAKMANFSLLGDACNNVIKAVSYDVSINDYEFNLTFGNVLSSIILEIILTFIFVYVILNVTDSKNNTSLIAGLIIGLTLTLVHLVGIPLTGTSVNPARSLATALAQLIYSGRAIALAQIWVFIIGPLAGGALAALIFKCLHKEDTKDIKENE